MNNLVKAQKNILKNLKLISKILNPRTFGGKHLKHFKKLLTYMNKGKINI